jgi:hypothetical protein
VDSIVSVLAWPAVVLIIALVAIFAFRTEVGALIGRTRKVGKGGLETFESQPPQPTDEKKGVDEFFRTFDNPLLVQSEELILQDLKTRKIEAPVDREKALVRALASTNLILHFERVYGTIWASQFAVLRFLNPRDDGAELSDLEPFYEAAKTQYPAWYENYTFDRWLSYLQSFNLILKNDSKVSITVAGQEFLKYLVALGKAGPYYG